MMDAPRQLWWIYRLHQQRGKHFNSPLVEEWRECGTVAASDEDTAATRARMIVGYSSTVRVELVDEFYKPESLQS